MGHSGVKVAYVVGKGRSGSTLLTALLGQIPGYAAVGELWQFWSATASTDRFCGCGLPIRDCDRWERVVARLTSSNIDFDEAERARAKAQSWMQAIRALPYRFGSGPPAIARYAEVQRHLYEAIADEFEADVIVDSSKWPADPILLGMVDGVDPYAIHLVRDPRGVVYSWSRRKIQVDHATEQEMPRHSSLQSSVSWLARNAVTEAVIRRMPPDHRVRTRYEDLVGDPQQVVATIARTVSSTDVDALFVGEREILMTPTHTMAGNPDRASMSGRLTVRSDDVWETRLTRRHYVITAAITSPLLKRYGYSIRRAPHASKRP